MKNKQYKEEDHGGYAINIEAFDIAGALVNPRIIENGNESLQTMGINTNCHDVDGYMNIDVKDDKTSTIDGTDASTFTTETIPLVDEKSVYILSKNKTLSLQNYWSICKNQEFRLKEGEGGNEFSCEEGQFTG